MTFSQRAQMVAEKADSLGVVACLGRGQRGRVDGVFGEADRVHRVHAATRDSREHWGLCQLPRHV